MCLHFPPALPLTFPRPSPCRPCQDGRRTLFQLPGSAGRQVAARAGAAAAGSDSTQPSTPAAPAASDPSASATEVTLAVRCQAAFGDTVAVVGEAPELGAWDPAAGVALTWGEGNVWTARLRLAPGAFSFKVCSDMVAALCQAAAPRNAARLLVQLQPLPRQLQALCVGPGSPDLVGHPRLAPAGGEAAGARRGGVGGRRQPELRGAGAVAAAGGLQRGARGLHVRRPGVHARGGGARQGPAAGGAESWVEGWLGRAAPAGSAHASSMGCAESRC